jgi:mono/diheme cytochrome c family protein
MRWNLIFAFASVWMLIGCKANPPSEGEDKVVQKAKELTIGGKDWQNPEPDTAESLKMGREHFDHHCQICHGLDGQNTGVPFADKMSPPVADLASADIQKYKDGQLKWIIQNGIRMTGMPGWQGIVEEKEMWDIVIYIRHLPAKGSLGSPAIYKEEQQEHEHAQEKSRK